MNFLLSAFVLLPLLSFLVTLVMSNKQEKGISFTAQFTTLLYIIASIAVAITWAVHDFQPLSEKLITLYQTPGFVFAIQFYYDQVTAVYSVVGALVFFLAATFSRYYMHRDEGFKRFFNTLLFFLTGYNIIIFSVNLETLFIGRETRAIGKF